MIAIRVHGIGRYFGPRLEMDGAEKPREAWQTLLRIAGLNVGADEDDTRATPGAAGHVLRDISFDVEQGSVLCLTGLSGSGKTVLLQVLAGLVPPTAGRVEIYGPVTSLLSTGDNVDMRATAIENIQASPAVAGVPPDEVARYSAEVIGFAELEGFEHVALRTFSTGMQLRLSMALALCGRPAIVLIDDVLGVGDIGFQQKVVDRLHALKESGTTIVLASSDEALVQQVATRVITLGGGRIVSDVRPGHWRAHGALGSAADVDWHVLKTLPADDVMALEALALEAAREGDQSFLDVHMNFDARVGDVQCWPSLFLVRARTKIFRTIYPEVVALSEPRRLAFRLRIPTSSLPNGKYSLTVSMLTVRNGTVHSMRVEEAVTLTIRRESAPAAGPDESAESLVLPGFPWEVEAVAGGS